MIRRLSTGPRVFRDRVNQIIDTVNALSTITGDGFVKVNKTRAGISVVLDVNKL